MVMREILDGFQGGLQIGGRMVTNVHYADDIILLATSEAELQELVDRLKRVSYKYSIHINVDKIKVMASDGIAYRILIQNEQLEQVDMFLYQVKQMASLQKIWKSHNEDKTSNEALVWPVATYGCESWPL